MKFVPKGWGWERWIVNEPKYCLKEMFCAKGRKCSLHYHNIKDETFYILEGSLYLDISTPEEITMAEGDYIYGLHWNEIVRNNRTYKVGDVIHIAPKMIHWFQGLTDCRFIEVSTQHFEEDSIRIIKGD